MPANVNNDASNASFCSAYELREKRRPSFDASRSCKVGCEPGPVSRTVAGCAARSCFAHGCGLRGTLLFRTRLRVARRGKLGQAVAGCEPSPALSTVVSCASRQAWPCGCGLRVAASLAMRLRVARRGKLRHAVAGCASRQAWPGNRHRRRPRQRLSNFHPNAGRAAHRLLAEFHFGAIHVACCLGPLRTDPFTCSFATQAPLPAAWIPF